MCSFSITQSNYTLKQTAKWNSGFSVSSDLQMKYACTSQKQVIRLKPGYTSNICELWNRRCQAFWPWATRQWILKTLSFLGRDCFESAGLVFSLPTVCFTARSVSGQGVYQHSKYTQVLLGILRSRNRMGIRDLSLNVAGILGWGCLQQSPVKSQVCSLFFQIAVVSLAVPSTALSHSLGCNKECCRYRLKAPWSAVKLPVVICTPPEPLQTHSAHCPNLELLGKKYSFLIFSGLLAYSESQSASHFLSYCTPILPQRQSVKLAELFK